MHMRAKAICNFQISYRPRTAVIYGRCGSIGSMYMPTSHPATGIGRWCRWRRCGRNCRRVPHNHWAFSSCAHHVSHIRREIHRHEREALAFRQNLVALHEPDRGCFLVSSCCCCLIVRRIGAARNIPADNAARWAWDHKLCAQKSNCCRVASVILSVCCCCCRRRHKA